MAKNDKPRSKNPAKPSASTDKPGERQINFRANPLLVSRLDNVAAAFGIDVSNLVRMVLNQNLPKYERQAERMRAGLPAEDETCGGSS